MCENDDDNVYLKLPGFDDPCFPDPLRKLSGKGSHAFLNLCCVLLVIMIFQVGDQRCLESVRKPNQQSREKSYITLICLVSQYGTLASEIHCAFELDIGLHMLTGCNKMNLVNLIRQYISKSVG